MSVNVFPIFGKQCLVTFVVISIVVHGLDLYMKPLTALEKEAWAGSRVTYETQKYRKSCEDIY